VISAFDFWWLFGCWAVMFGIAIYMEVLLKRSHKREAALRRELRMTGLLLNVLSSILHNINESKKAGE
jgi:hypothetical protein